MFKWIFLHISWMLYQLSSNHAHFVWSTWSQLMIQKNDISLSSHRLFQIHATLAFIELTFFLPLSICKWPSKWPKEEDVSGPNHTTIAFVELTIFLATFLSANDTSVIERITMCQFFTKNHNHSLSFDEKSQPSCLSPDVSTTLSWKW